MQTRFHHLDALRATAMLLGIVLHASLAYTGGPWIVRDEGHGGFAAVFFAIHGFRMQLFFLLSGFFTALLWRRLGLAGVLKQCGFSFDFLSFIISGFSGSSAG